MWYRYMVTVTCAHTCVNYVMYVSILKNNRDFKKKLVICVNWPHVFVSNFIFFILIWTKWTKFMNMNILTPDLEQLAACHLSGQGFDWLISVWVMHYWPCLIAGRKLADLLRRLHCKGVREWKDGIRRGGKRLDESLGFLFNGIQKVSLNIPCRCNVWSQGQ